MLAAHLYVDDDSSVTEPSHPIMYRSATETSEYRDEFSDLAPYPTWLHPFAPCTPTIVLPFAPRAV